MKKAKAPKESKEKLVKINPLLQKPTQDILTNVTRGDGDMIPDPDNIPGGYNPDGSPRLTILGAIAEAKLEQSEDIIKLPHNVDKKSKEDKKSSHHAHFHSPYSR